jgi:hypothetical protein
MSRSGLNLKNKISHVKDRFIFAHWRLAVDLKGITLETEFFRQKYIAKTVSLPNFTTIKD